MIKIAYWPNDSWCYLEEVERYQHEAGLSDDYAVQEVPDTWDDEDIELHVMVLNSGEQ